MINWKNEQLGSQSKQPAGQQFQVTFSCLAISLIAALWAMVPPQMEKCMACAKCLHAVGMFLATSVSFPWWEVPYDYESGTSAVQRPVLVSCTEECLMHLDFQFQCNWI